MKHRIKRMIVYVCVLILFLVCVLAAEYFIAYVFGSEMTFADAEKQVLVSFVGLILLTLFYLLIIPFRLTATLPDGPVILAGPFAVKISLSEKHVIRKCVYVKAYGLICLF
jgi:hypothetical protein